jgi:hypothetical protein
MAMAAFMMGGISNFFPFDHQLSDFRSPVETIFACEKNPSLVQPAQLGQPALQGGQGLTPPGKIWLQKGA